MTSDRLTEEWAALRNGLSKAYAAKDIDAALATARPRIAAAERERMKGLVELGEAWAEAEAALPDGWGWEMGDTSTETYWAQAYGPEVDGRHPREDGYGPTPAAALRALTAKLREAHDDQ